MLSKPYEVKNFPLMPLQAAHKGSYSGISLRGVLFRHITVIGQLILGLNFGSTCLNDIVEEIGDLIETEGIVQRFQGPNIRDHVVTLYSYKAYQYGFRVVYPSASIALTGALGFS